MKFNLIFFIVFLDSIFFSYSLVQQWNLINSSIDLLSSSDTAYVNITVMNETKDDLNVKLYKYFTKENGSVIYKKYLKVFDKNSEIYDNEVFFDNIDSYHQFKGKIIICPIGKYHPIILNGDFLSNHYNTLNENEDWELQCINHEQDYFLIFYLMKRKYHFFYKKSSSSSYSWSHSPGDSEINVIKLLNRTYESNDIDFTLAYIVTNSEWVKLNVDSLKIQDNGLQINKINRFNLTKSKTYTRGCFESNRDHFYFLTYSDNDFACGYYDFADNIDENFQQNQINKNEESPLEFFDEVKIEYIFFSIYNTIISFVIF